MKKIFEDLMVKVYFKTINFNFWVLWITSTFGFVASAVSENFWITLIGWMIAWMFALQLFSKMIYKSIKDGFDVMVAKFEMEVEKHGAEK